MDSSILQLFSVEEILDRITQRKLTGCFHAFAPKESANLFFKSGVVIAAVKGKTEGEPIVKQVLGWKEARYFWEPDAAPPTPPVQPLKLDVTGLLPNPRAEEKQPLAPALTASRPVISIASKGKSTGPLTSSPSPAPAKNKQFDNTATTTFTPSAEVRAAQDEALLNKYKFSLVSVDYPDQRYKLTQVSNLIGRNSACDIPISHPSISRQHCLVQLTNRGLHVKDLDTTNGTKVNGIVLREGYINAGDKLTFGHLAFVVEKE